MPIKKMRSLGGTVNKALDVNGDGVVDHKDAVAAAKIAGAAVAGAGATALISAAAGSAIVATGATALATKVGAIAGAAAGTFIAVTFGSMTTASFGVLQIGSTLLVSSSAVTTAVSAPLAAASAAGGALIGGASNSLAGFTVIQKVALSQAASAGKVITVAGVPMGVSAAVVAGLVAIVIVGGFAYYILTKDCTGKAAESSQMLPQPT